MTNMGNRAGTSGTWFKREARVPIDMLRPSPHRLSTLTDDLKKRARIIWPYLRPCLHFAEQSESEFIDGFCYDLFPEGEIFFWELFVLNIIDFFSIVSQREINLSEYKDDMDIDEVILGLKCLKIKALKDDSVLQTVLGVDKKLRAQVCESLMGLKHSVQTDVPYSKLLRAAIARCDYAEEQNAKAVAARKIERYQKAFGHQCSQCKAFSHDMKKCGRCLSINYCSRACQVKHYAEHKKVCKRPGGEASSSGKSS